MTGRMAAVRLTDGTTVTVPEPAWCTGEHEDGLHLVDLSHDGPEIGLTVVSGLREVEVLQAFLTQSPHATDPVRRAPYVTVLIDGEWHGFDGAGLHALASGLESHAAQLRSMARQLAQLRG